MISGQRVIFHNIDDWLHSVFVSWLKHYNGNSKISNSFEKCGGWIWLWMSLYFNAFILVIVREQPSCKASTDQICNCKQVTFVHRFLFLIPKFLNTRMKTIFHAVSSYLSFLVLAQIVSRAIKQESKKTRAHDAENANNLFLEHGVRAISCLCPFLKNRHEKPETITRDIVQCLQRSTVWRIFSSYFT